MTQENKIEIIPDFLDQPDLKKIQELTLDTGNFPYFYQKTLVFDPKNPESEGEGFFFAHQLYVNDRANSDYFNEICLPLLSPLKFKKLIRAKINLYTHMHKPLKSLFHTDQDTSHTVALYSVNTNNGYTVLQTGEKIPSIENQMVIFEGNRQHAAVTQTNTKLRVNININIM